MPRQGHSRWSRANAPSPAVVAAFAASGVLALVGLDTGRVELACVFKPLTTALLFLVIGRPDTAFKRFIAGGLLFSLLGDVALLWGGPLAFKVGMAAFLCAHVAYTLGFLRVAALSWRPVVAGVLAISTSIFVVHAAYPGAGGLRLPLIVYATALTTMVVSASATTGGHLLLARYAAIGAVLFYVGDASLAVDQFVVRIPHAALLTSGVYWLGQLGIATSARGGSAV
jgi:alkenylglycerophosphocholine hydrolase